MKERLDKILASQNIGSRKDVGLLIRKGAITVNGLVVIGDLHCLPAHLERLEKDGESWAKVTICEGKFHQVKRMFLARGKQVVYLERIQIGNLQLDTDLHRGETRELTEQERAAIFHK